MACIHPPPHPKLVQSAEGGKGKDKRERIIVGGRSPCQDNYPADVHPGAHKSVLESANPVWTWGVHLDAPGQRPGNSPVSGTADPRRSQTGQVIRGLRSYDQHTFGPTEGQNVQGRGPIGASKGKQTNTMALCQTPPPLIWPFVCPWESPLFLPKPVLRALTPARGPPDVASANTISS